MFSRMLIPPLCCILATAFATSLFVSAAPHPSLPGATVPDGLGVNIHFIDPMVGEMELLAAAGFRWVRMDLGWANIERELGVYDFSAFDRLTGHLHKHGMKALLILDYSNQLYESRHLPSHGQPSSHFDWPNLNRQNSFQNNPTARLC